MSLIAYWKCDLVGKQRPTSVPDESGHSNDHSFANITYFGSVAGFFHKRFYCPLNNHFYNAGNLADLRLANEMTVMAWLVLEPSVGSYEMVVGCANGTSEAQADNLLWSLRLDRTNDRFGMLWEHTGGIDVSALSPVGSIKVGEGPAHVCCVRSNNGGQHEVKFIKNGVDLSADVTALTVPDGGGSSVVEALRYPAAASTEMYTGWAWNIRVYDEALSVESVLAIRNAELGEAERTIVHTGSMLDTTEYPLAGWGDELV